MEVAAPIGACCCPAIGWSFGELLERLRVMEGVVTAGAIATTLVWSVLAVYNAMRVARHGGRT